MRHESMERASSLFVGLERFFALAMRSKLFMVVCSWIGVCVLINSADRISKSNLAVGLELISHVVMLVADGCSMNLLARYLSNYIELGRCHRQLTKKPS